MKTPLPYPLTAEVIQRARADLRTALEMLAEAKKHKLRFEAVLKQRKILARVPAGTCALLGTGLITGKNADERAAKELEFFAVEDKALAEYEADLAEKQLHYDLSYQVCREVDQFLELMRLTAEYNATGNNKSYQEGGRQDL